MLAFEQLAAAKEINRPMFCGGHEPGARLIRDAGYRPLLERGDESVLRKFFGDANVAHDPRETGDELRLLDPECVIRPIAGIDSDATRAAFRRSRAVR
jgi:hypothetical protein